MVVFEYVTAGGLHRRMSQRIIRISPSIYVQSKSTVHIFSEIDTCASLSVSSLSGALYQENYWSCLLSSYIITKGESEYHNMLMKREFFLTNSLLNIGYEPGVLSHPKIVTNDETTRFTVLTYN
jgi:hypothetical protein